MSVGNIRNTNDLENKKRQYAEMLQLMIENEGVKEKRIADYKNPNKPPPVPPQYKTVKEQQKDFQLQERTAIDNIKDLGVDFAEARSFVLQLEQKKDGIDNLVKLNTNFPAFKKSVLDKLNPKQLDSNSLLNAWDEFSANIDIITGLKSVSTKSTSIYSSATDAIEKLPTEDIIAEFNKFIKEQLLPSDQSGKLDISQQLLNSIQDNLTNAIKPLLSEEQLAKILNLTPIERNQLNTVAERLLSVNKIPTRNEIESLMTKIINSYTNLSEINYIKVSDEITSDLIKINRLLGTILDSDNKKRLAEFGDLVNKLVGNLYAEVSTATKPDIYVDEELSSSNKTKLIKFIMANKLNKNEDYFPEFVGMSDEEALEKLQKVKLGELQFRLGGYKKTESISKKDVENYLAKSKLQDRQEIIAYFIQQFQKNIVSNRGVGANIFFTINGYSLDKMRDMPQEEASQVLPTILEKLDIDSEDKADQYLYRLSEIVFEDLVREKLELDKSLTIEDFEKFFRFKLLSKTPQAVAEQLASVSYDSKKYTPDDYDMALNKLTSQKDVKQKKSPFSLTQGEAPPISRIDPYQSMRLTRPDFNMTLFNPIKKKDNTTLAVSKTDIDSQVNKVAIYLMGILQKFAVEDYYDRFLELQDEFRPYKDKIYFTSGKNVGKLKSLEYFQSHYTSAELFDFLLKTEYWSKNTDEAELILRGMIQSYGYNPENIEEHRRVPKQGFGMKKSKKKGGDLIHIDIGSHIGKNYKEKPDTSDSDSDSDKPKKGKGAVQVYIPEDNLNRPKPKVGCGSKPYVHRRIKIGKGVEVAEQQPKYIEFGKFIIHRPQLEKNTLNFKYPSEGRVPNLPIVNIGDDFKDFIIGVLETGKLSDNQFNKLSQNEKDFFIKAVKGAGLENSLFKGKGKLYPDEEKKDRDRFNILKGEFDAGNNNQNLIKELRQLVIKFVDKRIIPKKQGLEFLQQLE